MPTVSEFMDHDVVKIYPDELIIEAASKILRRGKRRGVVTIDDVPQGMVTLRDVARAILLGVEGGPKGIIEELSKRVSAWINPRLIVIEDSAPIHHALELMAMWDVGGLPVVDEAGVLVGLLDESSALKVCLEEHMPYRVWEFMSTSLWTARPGDSILDALRTMVLAGVRHLPVVQEGGRCAGIISLTDIVRDIVKAAEEGFEIGKNPLEKKVEEVMTYDLVTTKPGAMLADAAKKMIERGVSSALVLDDSDALVAIVTVRAVVRAVVMWRRSQWKRS